MSMPTVFVGSPYAGDMSKNIEYLKRAIMDSVNRGEAPFAPHMIYPLVLDDNDPESREAGISAGLSWGKTASKAAFYIDNGISSGMQREIRELNEIGVPIEFREIGK